MNGQVVADTYFERIEGNGWISQPDRGATSFLNRAKDDLNYSKEYWRLMDDKIMILPDDFDTMYERYITSIKGKYFYPEEKFREEWERYKVEGD